MTRISLALVTILTFSAGAFSAEVQVPLTLPADGRAAAERIPHDFIGFGYETSAVAVPHYFDPENHVLINLYRDLSFSGEVRIGGNISDRTQYVPEGVSAVKPQTETTIINRADLARLGAFLRATGWSAMWGVNLDTGSKAQAVEQAKAVTQALGSQLDSIEIGNEVDLRPRFHSGYPQFAAAWAEYRDAIRAALPDVVFSGPDVADRTAWVQLFPETAAGTKLHFLTHHYYRTNAKRPNATLDYLLAPAEPLTRTLTALAATSRAAGVPYRINETNSFSGGGKPGVSDTLGAALWTLDFLNQLAVHGCSGVNLETDINQFAWVSHYSPIGREGTTLHAKPPFYGMLAFAMTDDGKPQELAIDPTKVNATAYVSHASGGHTWLTLINKDAKQDAAFHWRGKPSTAWRLEGPSLEAKAGIRLAGNEVAPDGTWQPGEGTPLVPDASGTLALRVGHASAALIRTD